MNRNDILALAQLSRLSINEDDIKKYQDSFEGILEYINSIKSVEVGGYVDQTRPTNTNTMRSDDNPYLSGEFTEDLLCVAPQREGDYLKVSKVL
jgi:aspartyl/glutamyl-tRNA(Asn/Gln) amidotransferase C subunit